MRRWRSIEKYIRRKEGRVQVRQLARRFQLAPSTVSRGLARRGITLARTGLPWEACSNVRGRGQVKKCRQALALYFLGLSRGQVVRLLPIKSATLRKYILALTRTDEDGTDRRTIRYEDFRSLSEVLEEAYGLGGEVKEIFDNFESDGVHSFADDGEFLRQCVREKPATVILIRKLRRILGRKMYRHGLSIRVPGQRGQTVSVRVKSMLQ